VCVSSQTAEKAETAKKRSNAPDMKFIGDYDKKFAELFGLLVLADDWIKPEWGHKDNKYSQPAVFVVDSEGEMCFAWVSDHPGPNGRPEVRPLINAVLKTVEQNGHDFSAELLQKYHLRAVAATFSYVAVRRAAVKLKEQVVTRSGEGDLGAEAPGQ